MKSFQCSKRTRAAVMAVGLMTLALPLPAFAQVSTTSPATRVDTRPVVTDDGRRGFDWGWLGLLGLAGLAGLLGRQRGRDVHGTAAHVHDRDVPR